MQDPASIKEFLMRIHSGAPQVTHWSKSLVLAIDRERQCSVGGRSPLFLGRQSSIIKYHSVKTQEGSWLAWVIQSAQRTISFPPIMYCRAYLRGST